MNDFDHCQLSPRVTTARLRYVSSSGPATSTDRFHPRMDALTTKSEATSMISAIILFFSVADLPELPDGNFTFAGDRLRVSRCMGYKHSGKSAGVTPFGPLTAEPSVHSENAQEREDEGTNDNHCRI